jgi:2-phospho-L-lactate/phosphoenolpyruvate guanylyltransferase
MTPLAAVPVKRFFVAKRRLAAVLNAETRSRLGRDLAAHTVATITEAGAEPLVLAADAEVVDWAGEEGVEAMMDRNGGLDAAAAAGAERAAAEGRPWVIIHADLPLLTPDDVSAALAPLARGRPVIAASKDGGTSVVGGHHPIAFGYGPGSFHVHLRRLVDPEVLVRLGFALDLDDASDLRAARAHPRGAWLNRYPFLS